MAAFPTRYRPSSETICGCPLMVARTGNSAYPLTHGALAPTTLPSASSSHAQRRGARCDRTPVVRGGRTMSSTTKSRAALASPAQDVSGAQATADSSSISICSGPTFSAVANLCSVSGLGRCLRFSMLKMVAGATPARTASIFIDKTRVCRHALKFFFIRLSAFQSVLITG